MKVRDETDTTLKTQNRRGMVEANVKHNTVIDVPDLGLVAT